MLPITPERLLTVSSGDLFMLKQKAGMGWEPQKLLGSEVLILSTHGGLGATHGIPTALGFHTGHWELGAEEAITTVDDRTRCASGAGPVPHPQPVGEA